MALADVEANAKERHVGGVRAGIDEREGSDAESETVRGSLVVLGVLVEDGCEFIVGGEGRMLAQMRSDLGG